MVTAEAEALDGWLAQQDRLAGLSTNVSHRVFPDLTRIREDIDCLIAFGKQEGWPREEMQFLQEFLKEYGIGQV